MLYDMIAYIYHKYHPNVGKYTSHMGPFWKLLQLFDEKLVFCGTQMRVSLEGRASGLSCWYLMLMAEIRRSPVDGKVVEIPLFTRSSLPSQVVVWDFWTINSRNWITSPLYRYIGYVPLIGEINQLTNYLRSLPCTSQYPSWNQQQTRPGKLMVGSDEFPFLGPASCL